MTCLVMYVWRKKLIEFVGFTMTISQGILHAEQEEEIDNVP